MFCTAVVTRVSFNSCSLLEAFEFRHDILQRFEKQQRIVVCLGGGWSLAKMWELNEIATLS